MRAVTSPFVFGREVTGAELVDRTDELAELVRVLQHRRRHFLIGPRRFGKTSILVTAAKRVRELGGIVVMVNAEEFVTEAAVAAEIVAQTAKGSGLKLKTAMHRAQQLFGRLRPTMSYDPVQDTWSVKLNYDDAATQTLLVSEALEGLDRLGASVDVPVALIIDEFQALVADEGIAAERQLRAVIQRQRHVAYVFAGSDESMMTAITSDHGRPFYRLGSKRYLSAIPREDFRPHLMQAYRRAGAELTTGGAERILDLSRDVPYNVQRLGLACWEVVQRLAPRPSGTPVKIDEAFVQREFDRFLEIESPTYLQSITTLTTIQLKVLKFHAEQAPKPLRWQPVAKSLHLATSTFKRATSALVRRTILRRVYEEDLATRYAFEDPFLGEWVRRRLHV